MTIEEAIQHANEVAEKEDTCISCASQHRQLSDWLMELRDLRSKYAYLAADFDNYKKRISKNEKLTQDRISEDVILRFLNVYYDMERLYDNIDFLEDEQSAESRKEHVAYKMIFENFEKTLNGLGFEKIDCRKGDVFDVDTMHAISSRESKLDERLKTNEVADVFQSGWKHNGNTIRPVKVVVAR